MSLSQAVKADRGCPRPQALSVRSRTLPRSAGQNDQSPSKPTWKLIPAARGIGASFLLCPTYSPLHHKHQKERDSSPSLKISCKFGLSTEKCHDFRSRHAQICLKKGSKCEDIQRCQHTFIKCVSWHHKSQVTFYISLIRSPYNCFFMWRMHCLRYFSATYTSVIFHLLLWC